MEIVYTRCMQNTCVVQVDPKSIDEVGKYIASKCGELKKPNTGANFRWQARFKEGIVTAYNSGKIVVQSTDSEWCKRINEDLGGSANSSKTSTESPFVPHIGVDEAGKGDYFGPLVIAGVFVPSVEVSKELLELGVKDSKMLSDKKAIELREKILKLCGKCSEVVISPAKYNELYGKFKNANKLLAWGHARVIENILDICEQDECHNVTIDQFAKSEGRVLGALMEKGSKLNMLQMHKGESDIAVAAASVLARGRFLLELQELRNRCKFDFPKGASHVLEASREFVAKYGKEKLSEVAKVTFKTTSQI